MLKIEKTVLPSPEQWEIVIEGMRNPHNSHNRMDSYTTYIEDPETMETAPFEYFIGENDMQLMETLAKGGPVHAKYRRMIPVWVTVTAPLYWWKEFDTYKVGTTRNSCSTMHKIHVAPFTFDNFSTDDGIDEVDYAYEHMFDTIDILERLRQDFNETQEKRFWRALIQMLPDGYMMKATLKVNYEVLYNTYKWRRNHKQSEWHTWCHWIEELPYSEIITLKFENKMPEFCKLLNIPHPTLPYDKYERTVTEHSIKYTKKGTDEGDGMNDAAAFEVCATEAAKNLKEAFNRIYGKGAFEGKGTSGRGLAMRNDILRQSNPEQLAKWGMTPEDRDHILSKYDKGTDEGDNVVRENDRG